ncbi:MAG: hypothetical protein ACI90M_004280, partial [Candidatus Azotimanducaceae bacterium]
LHATLLLFRVLLNAARQRRWSSARHSRSLKGCSLSPRFAAARDSMAWAKVSAVSAAEASEQKDQREVVGD